MVVFWKEKNREKKERKNRIVVIGYLNFGIDERVDLVLMKEWIYEFIIILMKIF